MPASALLLLIAKVTVVLCGAACAAHLLRRASAAARHAVWTAGLAASLALSRAVAGLLFGIAPNDARTLVTVSALIGVVSLAASWVPARRAARVNLARVLSAG